MSGPFEPTAHVYDVVYAGLDYESHAATIEAVIRERSPDAQSLLDVACGTGKHLALYRDRFAEVAGADIDPRMLAVAAERLPDVPLHVADFTDFDLGRRFDAVTCLFSSIGYAATPEALDGAIASMARHLKPGGVLVVEPWLQPELLDDLHLIRAQHTEGHDLAVLRSARWINADTALDDGVSVMEFAYLVTTPNGSEVFTEVHSMGLYRPEQYVAAVESAGLRAEFLTPGTFLERGLLVGIAR